MKSYQEPLLEIKRKFKRYFAREYVFQGRMSFCSNAGLGKNKWSRFL